uniref:Uncharacterized protein n=1 Tax=Rhizophora mucronata TaxID=61149 RepID=A0A2P2JAJ7_RHIMU
MFLPMLEYLYLMTPAFILSSSESSYKLVTVVGDLYFAHILMCYW